MTDKPCLLNLSRGELEKLLTVWGEPTYRVAQIETWLYSHYVDDVTQMTTLPSVLRQLLADETTIDPLTPITTLNSTDGRTSKTLFALPDGKQIETVLMQYNKRHTVCISTQVGCAIACPFCATGQMGFARNLSSGEIVAQLLYYARQLNKEEKQVTNIVFMGMGEPFDNYNHTWQAIRRLNNQKSGFGLGSRRMTISTAGVAPAIHRMSKEPEQINLAVSLHTASDSLRDIIVPINKRYPLAVLMQAVQDYIAITNRRVTFEYALMDNLNDSEKQAEQLTKLLRGLLCHVNLIPLNPTADSPWSGSPQKRVTAFRDRLEAAGIPTTVRLRRGVDIAAGCGQLYGKKPSRLLINTA